MTSTTSEAEQSERERRAKEQRELNAAEGGLYAYLICWVAIGFGLYLLWNLQGLALALVGFGVTSLFALLITLIYGIWRNR